MHHCNVETELAEKGLRNTKDRHDILSLFERDRAWTVADLRKALRRADLSTVYRNVQTLQREGLVVPIHAHGGESVFERAGRAHHDHLQCEQCQTTACVPCPVPKLSAHTLELFGRCTACT